MTEEWILKPLLTLYDDGGEGEGDEGGEKPAADQAPATPELPEGAFTAENWRDALPEDVRQSPALDKVANLEGLTRSYLAATKHIGGNPDDLMKKPDVNDPEAVKGMLKTLGAPDAVEGYELTAGDNVPDFVKPDGELAGSFKEAALGLGLLPAQVQGVYSWFAGKMGETLAATSGQSETDIENNDAALKAEWGAAYGQKMGEAKFAIEKLGGSELLGVLEGSGAASEPIVIKALAQMGAMLSEDDSEGVPNHQRIETPNEARSKGIELNTAAMMEADPTKAKALSAEAQKWFAKANNKVIGPV